MSGSLLTVAFFMLIQQEDILSTGNLELLARHAVEGFITGFHKSPFHGFSVEFAEHRQYNPGESIRHIDWRLYGRTDKLFVKRFEEETNLRCSILLDASSSMHLKLNSQLSKFQYSIWCAATFLTLLKKQRDAASLMFFDEKIVESTGIGSSGRHFRALFTELNKWLMYQEFRKQTNIAEILHLAANQMHRRSMVVVFTDLLSPDVDLKAFFNSIQHLKHNKHEVIIFNTIHGSKEIDLEYGNQAITFEDLESGEQLKIHPNEIKEEYSLAIKTYLNEIKLKCAQYKVDFVEADTAKGVEQAIIPFLIKRNRMAR